MTVRRGCRRKGIPTFRGERRERLGYGRGESLPCSGAKGQWLDCVDAGGESMKALVYTAPYSMELQELPDPEAGRDEVIVEVATAGICGSDVHGFQGRSRIRIPPMVMGHEFTGRVAALGEGVQ